MTEIAEMIEDGTRALVEESGFESGIGFPTGLSVNEVAAHYTPNAGDTKSESWRSFGLQCRSDPSSDAHSIAEGRRHEGRLRCSRQRANRRFCVHPEL